METIIVVDAETTGVNVLKDDPIQIAYAVYQGKQKIEEQEIFLLTEYVPTDIVQITGITPELLAAKGIPHVDAARQWCDVIRRVNPDVLVGHNIISFDHILLSNWLLRVYEGTDFRLPAYNQIFDTMMSARSKFGIQKWLTLKTLATKLDIAVEENRLHNALYDIEITAKCYFEMTKSNHTNINSEGPQQLLF